jgi:hypothetical protein
VNDSIIHIPTKSSSNEIKNFVVVFVPHQLTLGRVVERRWDYVRLLYDLPNGTILAQEIVASSILPKTKILIIEDHKFYVTFLHIVFGSQNLLRQTSDQTGSDTNWRTGEG